jgi:hypothetical protein
MVRKTAGQVTAIPKGPVPEMRLISDAELICCSFDRSFMDRIVDGLEGPHVDRMRFRSGLPRQVSAPADAEAHRAV